MCLPTSWVTRAFSGASYLPDPSRPSPPAPAACPRPAVPAVLRALVTAAEVLPDPSVLLRPRAGPGRAHTQGGGEGALPAHRGGEPRCHPWEVQWALQHSLLCPRGTGPSHEVLGLDLSAWTPQRAGLGPWSPRLFENSPHGPMALTFHLAHSPRAEERVSSISYRTEALRSLVSRAMANSL